MLELVIFDADGVLFDSVESNTAYYNAIFAAIGEPPLSPDEERACIFLAAMTVFELRAREDAAKLARMREVARTIDFAPFFKLLRPPLELRPFLLELKRRYRVALGHDARSDRASWPRRRIRRGGERARQGPPQARTGHRAPMPGPRARHPRTRGVRRRQPD